LGGTAWVEDRYVATGEKNGLGELFDLGEKKKSGSFGARVGVDRIGGFNGKTIGKP
jgi:hypothetical protein